MKIPSSARTLLEIGERKSNRIDLSQKFVLVFLSVKFQDKWASDMT